MTEVTTAEVDRPAEGGLAVLYTDGGCLQDRKIGGWGVHGYFYENTPAKVGTGCKKAVPTADGYVNGSGLPQITVTHYYDGFASLPTDATNNIAELSGMIHAMQTLIKYKASEAIILCDSQYVLNGVTKWLKNWIASKWISASTGQPIANRPQWELISSLLEQLAVINCKIRYKWVKGHDGEFGNGVVDYLATLSIRAAINGRPVESELFSPAKGYWKSGKTHSRLLNLPTWHYGVREDARHQTDDGRTIYYQGDLREAVNYNGKMISDACFSVLYLKEPDVVLETIRQLSCTLAQASFYGLAVGHLNTIFKPANYELIETHGTQFLTYDVSKNRLLTQHRDPEVLVEELRPVSRAYYAVDRLHFLEEILKAHVSKEEDRILTFTDITTLLYEVVPGKKSSSVKLRNHITSATRSIEAVVQCRPIGAEQADAKVLLLLAQDLPDRNTLSALASEDLKVFVVTWADSASVVRYATIVETAGDVGIWSGVYSNIHVLPPASTS